MKYGIGLPRGINWLLSCLFGLSCCQAQPLPEATAEKLPVWRGFNLLNKFSKGHKESPFLEQDFRWISEMGFNFVRLPMDYRQWITDNDWTQLNDKALCEIDQAVEYGKKYNIHVNINFHRAPGYTVASPPEPQSLWTDSEAQRVCAMHWAAFARRYKGIPNRNLSFNLLNEPANVSQEAHEKVVTLLVQAIRAEDPNRLIIADGLNYGRIACRSLTHLKIAQATRGYEPMQLTHYKAGWVGGSDRWPMPSWPPNEDHADRRQLMENLKPWIELKDSNVGVMVGEWGVHNQTPHAVTLQWMENSLINYRQAGMGWALWNLYGSFGILDSGRKDVQYEDFHGHQLDRRMLELLQKY